MSWDDIARWAAIHSGDQEQGDGEPGQTVPVTAFTEWLPTPDTPRWTERPSEVHAAPVPRNTDDTRGWRTLSLILGWRASADDLPITVHTPRGPVPAHRGHWLVRRADGELLVMDRDVFPARHAPENPAAQAMLAPEA